MLNDVEIETFNMNLSIFFTDILTDEPLESNQSCGEANTSEDSTFHEKGKYQ